MSLSSRLISDNYFEIAKHIDDGKTWKAFIASSRLIYNTTSQLHEEKKFQLINPLWTLLTKYPDKEWSWYWISRYRWRKVTSIPTHDG